MKPHTIQLLTMLLALSLAAPATAQEITRAQAEATIRKVVPASTICERTEAELSPNGDRGPILSICTYEEHDVVQLRLRFTEDWADASIVYRVGFKDGPRFDNAMVNYIEIFGFTKDQVDECFKNSLEKNSYRNAGDIYTLNILGPNKDTTAEITNSTYLLKCTNYFTEGKSSSSSNKILFDAVIKRNNRF